MDDNRTISYEIETLIEEIEKNNKSTKILKSTMLSLATSVKLPEHPAQLIHHALACLEYMEENPKYRINMYLRHLYMDNLDVCTVNLAGSVIAHNKLPSIRTILDATYSLKFIVEPYKIDSYQHPAMYPNVINNQLLFLEYINIGAIQIACNYLNSDWNLGVDCVKVCPYEQDSQQHKLDILAIVNLFHKKFPR